MYQLKFIKILTDICPFYFSKYRSYEENNLKQSQLILINSYQSLIMIF